MINIGGAKLVEILLMLPSVADYCGVWLNSGGTWLSVKMLIYFIPLNHHQIQPLVHYEIIWHQDLKL